MADNPAEPPASGILRSNVGVHVVADAPKERRAFPITMLLVALLTFVAGGLTVLFLTGRAGPQPQAVPTLASTQTPTVVANSRSRSAAPVGAPLPAVNGISCDALESTIFHIHVHLAIFFDGVEQLVPLGVGIGQPWQVEDSAEGP